MYIHINFPFLCSFFSLYHPIASSRRDLPVNRVGFVPSNFIRFPLFFIIGHVVIPIEFKLSGRIPELTSLGEAEHSSVWQAAALAFQSYYYAPNSLHGCH